MSTDLMCLCGHARSEHAYVVADGPCGARSDGCQKFTVDLKNLPTSILIELYLVAVDGVVTEMHKAMQARHETLRRTGYRRAAIPDLPTTERQS